MGGVYQELMAAEKKIDGFIDACKREELKEGDVGKEIERFGAYLSRSQTPCHIRLTLTLFSFILGFCLRCAT
jgi:hypothetical protein